MLTEALIAWLHFLAIFVLVGALAGELILFRREMSVGAQRMLRITDLHYGLAAAVVVITGLLRVFWFGKGSDYYASSRFFWVLVGLFVVVGLLSVPPTLFFMRWRKSTSPITVADADYRRIRRFLWIETGLIVLAPLAATLMARGIG